MLIRPTTPKTILIITLTFLLDRFLPIIVSKTITKTKLIISDFIKSLKPINDKKLVILSISKPTKKEIAVENPSEYQIRPKNIKDITIIARIITTISKRSITMRIVE